MLALQPRYSFVRQIQAPSILRLGQRKDPHRGQQAGTVTSHPKVAGNPDGPLYGLQIVFTGQLSIPRAEAAKLAAKLGLFVQRSVSKKTSLVVVGNQDIRLPEWDEKSTKHRRAEELIAQGIDILIVSESDFFALMDAYSKRGTHEVG